MTFKNKTAVIAGIGPGLGGALCQKLVDNGYRVAGLARTTEAGKSLLKKLGEESFLSIQCDITNRQSMEDSIVNIEKQFGTISVYIHNAYYLQMDNYLDTSPDDFKALWEVTCLGAVYGTQYVLPGMLEQNEGCIIATGATASVKAGSGFSAFSSAKFALRGLMQSLAREYGPQGIHIAHVINDGLIWGQQAEHKFSADKNNCLLPEAIADSYLHLIQQHRSAWTQELDLRPDSETF